MHWKSVACSCKSVECRPGRAGYRVSILVLRISAQDEAYNRRYVGIALRNKQRNDQGILYPER